MKNFLLALLLTPSIALAGFSGGGGSGGVPTNAIIQLLNTAPGVTTITSAGGTTALTAASTMYQRVIGTANQTITLPDQTTIPAGTAYVIDSDTTGIVTVKDSAGTTLATGLNGNAGYIYSMSNATATGNWGGYAFVPAGMTFPTNAATLARTDAGQTFTGNQAINGALSTTGQATIAGVNVGQGAAAKPYSTVLGAAAGGAANAGDYMTAIGYSSLISLSTGTQNTGVGTRTLQSTTTGSFNFAGGSGAGYLLTTGSSNVFIGHLAGATGNIANATTSGNNNIIIGESAGSSVTANLDNTIVIGANATTSASNTTVVGNSSTVSAYIAGVVKLSSGSTVAGLATCNAGYIGYRSYVTDALAPTFLGVLTGGGTVVTPVFCNGTAWVAN